jgi:hypothetical protein
MDAAMSFSSPPPLSDGIDFLAAELEAAVAMVGTP